jgi:predicted metal-binding protein
MELRAEISAVQIPMEQLMISHKLEKVLGYCKNCGNYMKNYSCPDFQFDIMEYLNEYNYATVIMTKINSDLLTEKFLTENVNEDSFNSKVLTNYKSENLEKDVDLNSKISMFMFSEVKDYMTDKLLEIEKNYKSSTSLPPGSCTRCDVCLKRKGERCLYPENLRYSLESLGFLVSDIYRDVFESELGWSNDKLPESFNTCSALLTKDIIKVSELKKEIGKIIVKIN